MKQLDLVFEQTEDNACLRIDAVKLLYKADQSQTLYWTIQCHHIEKLHFHNTDFRKQEIKP